MRRISTVIGVIALAFLILLAGCYDPGGPVPEGAHPPVARDYTEADVDSVVVMEEAVISSPLPAEWGAPESCDEIHFLRFRPADGSTLDPEDSSRVDAVATDAMLLMLPGVLEGANGFEYLARNLIYQAKVQDGLNLEVWAVERRNNRLEDLYAFNYVEDKLSAGEITTQEAVDALITYYYEGQPLNGVTPACWLTNADLPFLAEFGLQLDTEDVFTVIQTMVPDPEVRREKVFVGGHSMGGPMTAYFVGWDLDGDPATTDDAGYNNCAGLFGFDASLSPMDGFVPTTSEGTVPDLFTMPTYISESDYMATLERMRDGTSPVLLNAMPVLGAEAMGMLEASALFAYFDPDSEAIFISDIPWTDNMQLILNLMNSRDLITFMAGTPELQDFRFTNEALLGIMFDDSFVPVGMIQNSMGFLQGGPVVLKEFPTVFTDVIPGLSGMFGEGPYYIANDAGPASDLGTGPLYSWVNFDEIGDSSDPDYTDTSGEVTFTTMENEVADIHDVARALFKGPLNLVEWYFSARLMLDFQASGESYAPAYGLNYLYGDKVAEMPQILFLAGSGMLAGTEVTEPNVYMLEGYNHLDVLTACANASARRPNGVIRPLIDFVKGNPGEK